MKKTFILSFASLILLSSCGKENVNTPPSPVLQDTLATGWKKIKLIDSSTFFSDIFFINNTGYAVGHPGIFKSLDGGENWSHLQSPSDIESIAMGSERNAIFTNSGRNNQLVITHNGGASFITKTLADDALSDAFFVDSTVAYAVGNSFWKTIDGGDNWKKLYDFRSTNASFNSLFFTNEQIGWVSTEDSGYKTINGGMDWQRIYTDTLRFLSGGGIFCLNADTGYIANNFFIYKTVNAGASWNKVFICTHQAYHDIHFVSENEGYITDGSCIFKTTDSGNTWTKVVAIPNSYFNELHFTDANHGWACGDKGLILKYVK